MGQADARLAQKAEPILASLALLLEAAYPATDHLATGVPVTSGLSDAVPLVVGLYELLSSLLVIHLVQFLVRELHGEHPPGAEFQNLVQERMPAFSSHCHTSSW